MYVSYKNKNNNIENNTDTTTLAFDINNNNTIITGWGVGVGGGIVHSSSDGKYLRSCSNVKQKKRKSITHGCPKSHLLSVRALHLFTVFSCSHMLSDNEGLELMLLQCSSVKHSSDHPVAMQLHSDKCTP